MYVQGCVCLVYIQDSVLLVCLLYVQGSVFCVCLVYVQFSVCFNVYSV